VLDQEVNREMAVRRAEAQAAMERQEDLGLDDLPAQDTPKGREALPDVGAIDKELEQGLEAVEPRDKAQTDLDPEVRRKRDRRRFQLGFWCAVLVVAGLVCLYLFADRIGAAMPPAQGPLAAYVAWVDGIRSWLTEQANAAQMWLDGLRSPAIDAATGAGDS